ncbi:hypothetical protein FHS61_001465 [Altererythrobacter atlanticus]|uniref:Uncharacterized protein n=1 Tax=Croceibacterium atlanticum TaxID=1267766 RepID=A0A0F7KY26_9SPHN|nr:hypothetical protein WYH_03127 [Croceibacterium atlanticum]MBB5732456.1 hypothetical protein [Croceibacterium atlanticum]
MSNRKTMQAPKARTAQSARGFWEWLLGGYYR